MIKPLLPATSSSASEIERAGISTVKPLHKIRTAQTIDTLRQQHDRATILAGVARHVECFVRLNEIDVVGRSAATRDDNVSLCREVHRMLVQICCTSCTMRDVPIATKHLHDPLLRTDDRSEERRVG